jgi:hypothetical protein
MKKLNILGFVTSVSILIAIIILNSSCGSTKYGCPNTGHNRYVNNKFTK